ncbi:MAG: hypothetical protein WBZ25_16355 [Pseudolabrys sp.]|jgi:hypothetical protein
MQSALRTLHALRRRENVDALTFEVMKAITKHYLRNAAQPIDEVNAQLPYFIKDIEAQRQQITRDVVRWMDEPNANQTLQ